MPEVKGRRRLFIKVEFVEWLRGLELDQPIQAVDRILDAECPLQLYARKALGKSVMVKFDHYTTIESGENRLPLPKWAKNFVNEIDNFYWKDVTPRIALKALGVRP